MNDIGIAYAELDEILSYMSSEYIDKIPLEFKELVLREKAANYINKIDVNKPLEEQNLQRKTLILLAVLWLNYWCTNEKEKQEFLNELNTNQEEYAKKYSAEALFENNQKEDKTENSQLIQYQEKNVFKSIIDKIKKFFRRS